MAGTFLGNLFGGRKGAAPEKGAAGREEREVVDNPNARATIHVFGSRAAERCFSGG